MKDERHVATIKKIYERQHVEKDFKGDTSEHVKKALSEQQQVAFLKEIWHLSQQTYRGPADTVKEPAEMLAAKMKAIQSLSQAESTTFSWKDFKRACKMITIWIDSKRNGHMRRGIQPAEDKAEAELDAMVAAGTTSWGEVNAIDRAGVNSW